MSPSCFLHLDALHNHLHLFPPNQRPHHSVLQLLLMSTVTRTCVTLLSTSSPLPYSPSPYAFPPSTSPVTHSRYACCLPTLLSESADDQHSRLANLLSFTDRNDEESNSLLFFPCAFQTGFVGLFPSDNAALAIF